MELMIGYGGISVCGSAISVTAVILQTHPFLILVAFICYISSVIIYLQFIAEHLLIYQVPIPPRQTWIGLIFALIFLVFGAAESFLISYSCANLINGFNPAVVTGSICFFFSKVELFTIISNGVRLKDTSSRTAPLNYSARIGSLSDQLGDSRSPSPYEFNSDDEELRVPRTVIAGRISPESVIISVVSSSNASGCNICLLQYSNLVIPRILIGCGHTFCEICIRKLPRTKHNPAVFVGSICFLLVKTELVSIIFNGVLLENTSRRTDPVNRSARRAPLLDQLGDSRCPSPYKFDSDDEELQVPRTVIAGRISPESVVITVVSSSNASDCNICLLQYSNHVIPRILVGCGHTFCEICIRKLPRTIERVSCPLCRNITLLPCGRSDLLPKNYTVMDMIQERNS
ncbi:unnamed protein product [Caenorhabditis brenneri]